MPTMFSVLEIHNRPGAENQLTCGNNVEVLLDGKPIPGLFGASFQIVRCDLAKVTLELWANIKVDVNVKPEIVEYQRGIPVPNPEGNDPFQN